MWSYLLVFLSALAVDLIPIVAPPAWTVMVALQMIFDLNIWGVLVAGVAGSVLGRYLFSRYIPKVSSALIKRRKNDELEFVGRKLSQKRWRSWLFVFIYTLTPLSTTPLFTAAGIAKVKPIQIIPPFFCGKFISDMVMVITGRYAAGSVREVIQGTVSWKGIASLVLGLLLVGGLLFVDWRQLLQRRKFRLNFRIWK